MRSLAARSARGGARAARRRRQDGARPARRLHAWGLRSFPNANQRGRRRRRRADVPRGAALNEGRPWPRRTGLCRCESGVGHTWRYSDRGQSRESALSGCRQGYFRCGRELLARAVRVSVPTALESLGRRVLINTHTKRPGTYTCSSKKLKRPAGTRQGSGGASCASDARYFTRGIT